MPGQRGGGVHTPIWLPWFVYLGGHSLTLTDATSVEQPLPARCTGVEITAEGGVVYANVNAAASAGSPYFIAENACRPIGPLSNLRSLHLCSDNSGAIAHIAFYCEHVDLPGA